MARNICRAIPINCDDVFFKIAPAFRDDLNDQAIGELCLVGFDHNIEKYIAVASLSNEAFNDLSNFREIKNRLKVLGAKDITILLTVEDEENDIIESLCIDSSKEVTIYFNLEQEE